MGKQITIGITREEAKAFIDRLKKGYPLFNETKSEEIGCPCCARKMSYSGKKKYYVEPNDPQESSMFFGIETREKVTIEDSGRVISIGETKLNLNDNCTLYDDE